MLKQWNKHVGKINFKWLSITILVYGALLRLLVYFQNRSLFIDEANLARNYIEKTLLALWQPLSYEQYAPPIFSSIQKICWWVFGNQEFSLRLFPLVSGLLALFLFYKLCRYFLPLKIAVYPLALFAVSETFIRYSTEIKQYSTDMMLTLVLLLLALHIAPSKLLGKTKTGYWLLWAIVGAVAVWFSMPSIFVLAAIGAYYGLSFIQQKNSKALLPLVFTGAIWLISFGLYYFQILAADIGSDYLQKAHEGNFLPFPPLSMADLKTTQNILHQIIRTTIGVTALAIVWGIICWLLGMYQLIKTQQLKSLLILLPIVFCWAASAMHQYSLMPRLSLFYIPLLMLLIGVGANWLLAKSKVPLKILWLALMLISVGGAKSYQYLYKPYQLEELKPILTQLSALPPSNYDFIHIHHEAVPSFRYYVELSDYAMQFPLKKYHYTKWNNHQKSLKEKLATQQGPTKVWLLFSHTPPRQVAALLPAFNKMGKQLKAIESKRASAYLYVFE